MSDILVAAVDFSNDTVTALVGVDGDAHGIVKGYASGNLSFTANLWGGVVNAGEFGLSGTQFTPNVEETKYYALNGQRVAMARNGVVFYLHGDHLGSASLTTDASGAVVSEMRYYPYGETRSGGTPTDRRYTGQREEARLGLYDYGARYYDPALGRFIQADTIVPEPGNPQSLNRYSYVLGNPLSFVDPSGHGPQPALYSGGGDSVESPLTEFYGLKWEYDDDVAFDANDQAGRDELWEWFSQHPNYNPDSDPVFGDPEAYGVRYSAVTSDVKQYWAEWQGVKDGVQLFQPGVVQAVFGPLGVFAVSMVNARDQLSNEAAVQQILGRGSTGRTTPSNLREQLAMEQAMSDPRIGDTLDVNMTDTRWPGSEGWVKKAQNINGVEIHYVYNTVTGAVDDYKFVPR